MAEEQRIDHFQGHFDDKHGWKVVRVTDALPDAPLVITGVYWTAWITQRRELPWP